MKDRLESALKTLEDVKAEFKNWCRDKTVPLDERWDLFIKSGLGQHQEYIERFGCKIGIDFIESLEYRHENQDVCYILEWATDEEYSTDEVIKFKEAVLSSFVKSYTFDW